MSLTEDDEQERALDRHEFVGHLMTEHLVAIVTDAVDIKQLAHEELQARGVAA